MSTDISSLMSDFPLQLRGAVLAVLIVHFLNWLSFAIFRKCDFEPYMPKRARNRYNVFFSESEHVLFSRYSYSRSS